jgi:hypothetical protein
VETTTATGSGARAASDAPALVDPRAPRFGQTLTAGLLTVAVLLQWQLLVGGVTAAAAAGYAVAGLVALLAGLAAALDICVGCRLYRQVGFVRRLGIV